jgi:hypothetical protein
MIREEHHMTPNLTATTGAAERRRGDDDAGAEHLARRAARDAHPAGRAHRGERSVTPGVHPAWPSDDEAARPPVADHLGAPRPEPAEGVQPPSGEDGSLVTEYGLLAVVAATVAGVVIQWASGGALVTLFNALLRHARSLVGA